MFCTKCGKELDDGARFCKECGTAIEQSAGVSQVGEDAPTASSATMNTASLFGDASSSPRIEATVEDTPESLANAATTTTAMGTVSDVSDMCAWSSDESTPVMGAQPPASAQDFANVGGYAPQMPPAATQNAGGYTPQMPPMGAQGAGGYTPQMPPMGAQNAGGYTPQMPPMGTQNAGAYTPQMPPMGAQGASGYTPQMPPMGAQGAGGYAPQMPPVPPQATMPNGMAGTAAPRNRKSQHDRVLVAVLSGVLVVALTAAVALGYLMFSNQQAVAINANNFPDNTFRAYVQGFDANQDGKLSKDEISAVQTIDISQHAADAAKVKSLKGVEYFTALNYLNASNNDLSGDINLSYNRNLTVIIIENNEESNTTIHYPDTTPHESIITDPGIVADPEPVPSVSAPVDNSPTPSTSTSTSTSTSASTSSSISASTSSGTPSTSASTSAKTSSATLTAPATSTKSSCVQTYKGTIYAGCYYISEASQLEIPDATTFPQSAHQLVFANGKCFYIPPGGGTGGAALSLYMSDADGANPKVIAKDAENWGDLYVCGDWLYYHMYSENSNAGYKRYNIESGEAESVSLGKSANIVGASSDYLFYIDSSALYRCSPDGSGSKKICSASSTVDVEVLTNGIIVTEKSSSTATAYDFDGGKIWSAPLGNSGIAAETYLSGSTLYVSSSDGKTLYMVDIATGKAKTLSMDGPIATSSNGVMSVVYADGDNVYLVGIPSDKTDKENTALFSVSLSSGSGTELNRWFES